MGYTKGKWRGEGWTVVCDKNDTRTIGIAEMISGESDYEITANTHLIAAAPDLYEALKAINFQLLGANIPFSQEMFDTKRKTRQAIAKAEGEQGNDNNHQPRQS